MQSGKDNYKTRCLTDVELETIKREDRGRKC